MLAWLTLTVLGSGSPAMSKTQPFPLRACSPGTKGRFINTYVQDSVLDAGLELHSRRFLVLLCSLTCDAFLVSLSERRLLQGKVPSPSLQRLVNSLR